MITPYLEKLIHEGKASYKTFTAGGSASQVLSVSSKTYIIITDLIHFPYMPVEIEGDIDSINGLTVTQMAVFSEGSYNNFVFRNQWGAQLSISLGGFLQNNYVPGSPVKIDTYLIHDDDVSFNFSKGGALTTNATGVKPSTAPAKRPRTGYGKEGINTAIGNTTVELRKTPVFGAEFRPLGKLTDASSGDSYTQLQFPVINGSTNLVPVETDQVNGYPIVQVGYVEILAERNNVQTSTN